jgi:hypothetical protein
MGEKNYYNQKSIAYDPKIKKLNQKSFILFTMQHRRPFCPTDVLVVGSTPFVFDERRAIRVVQVLDSGTRKKVQAVSWRGCGKYKNQKKLCGFQKVFI